MAFTQANRSLRINTPLGADAVILTGLRGEEAVSSLFRFDAVLAAESQDLAFEAIVGKNVTVVLEAPGAAKRYLNGYVSQFAHVPRQGDFQEYRAEIVPWAWFLTQTLDCRIFQDLSVPEIVGQVQDGVTFRLEGTYAKRDYVTQYNETDFAFVSRLMSEEGIFFFFEHSQDAHQLVLADTPSAADEAGTFRFDDGTAGRVDPARVTAWEKTQELTAGKVTLRDHHFALPGSPLEGTATILSAVQAGQVTHRLDLTGTELYEYPGGYAAHVDGAEPGDLQRLAQEPDRAAALRMEAETARALVVAGTSTVRTFAAGLRFGLGGHPNGDGAYVLTGVRHTASQPAGANGDVGFTYANAFTCIPAGVPFRPPPAERPVAPLQTAVVAGPAGMTIHTDRFWRVKVQFFWDREGRHDEHSSRWIRVSQPVGGAGAALWVPQVGDEVLVAFEHGDPDRPYVLGRVFDSDDRPPDGR